MVHIQHMDQHRWIPVGQGGRTWRQRSEMREVKERRDGEYYKTQDLERGKEKVGPQCSPFQALIPSLAHMPDTIKDKLPNLQCRPSAPTKGPVNSSPH